tara:strand:+ start:1133 stop:1642 length:510 start_codon:yes stop_codon:yes gene_type:complete
MTDASVDKESLRFLVNPAYQAKLVQSQKKEVTEDRRQRYRHRINELHRAMMKGDCPESALKAAHDVFVGAAIKFARFEEKRLLVAQELDGLDTSCSAEAPVLEGGEVNISAMSAKAFGRAKKPPTIDSFVTRTSSAPPPHVPRRRRKKKSKPKVDVPGTNKEASVQEKG